MVAGGRVLRADHAPGPALPGFEQINRYWDRQRACHVAKILPGEYYVTTHAELITTVLGSCVSACIRDPVFGIGGMNHFMLPLNNRHDVVHASDLDSAARYGNFAMEKLINSILANGGRREHLEFKLFGGGRIIRNMSLMDIGRRNIEFVRDYLATEGFGIAAEDLGGPYPRKVVYDPLQGRAQVKKLRSLHNDTIVRRERRYEASLEQVAVESQVDLFE